MLDVALDGLSIASPIERAEEEPREVCDASVDIAFASGLPERPQRGFYTVAPITRRRRVTIRSRVQESLR
jgi:hypothetical protein